MYPILILRSELACLVILIFLYFTSRTYNIDSQSRAFSRILKFALLHIVFDIITVLTVNHVETVPGWMNWFCHMVFYVSAILYSNEIANYVVTIVYPKSAKKLYYIGHLLTVLFVICCILFLRIDYVEDLGTYSSSGPAAYVGYGLAFTFFIAALVIIFTHMNKMSLSIKSALIPMMLVLMCTEICQIIWRSVLFTGGAVTIVTVGFFFSLENPVEVFKKKAMTDALTGVRSRRSYEEDIEQLDVDFVKNPGGEYIFVFCDLNDLRKVNNQFGHSEGDNYITLIATSINQCMKHSMAVYRIGGDEFLICYYRVGEEKVKNEIHALHDACVKASETLNYTAAVAVGYAVSSSSYISLKDVVKTADYEMYQNKFKMKDGTHTADDNIGTSLNYTGLTDKMFDAMCASNDKSYPFITNLNTNVTRIAPGWKEYFGLDSEFYTDFALMWQKRIHPDYIDGYTEDVIATINGHKKYHHYDYYAKKPDGDYVKVSCYGSLYTDSMNDTPYFTGFIVNYGVYDTTDSVTGLKNFDNLTARVCRYMDDGKPFSVMKLVLNNFGRVNMLYGYSRGTEVLKTLGTMLCSELGSDGEVFCQDAINFTVLFSTADKDRIENYYSRIKSICEAGLKNNLESIPVQLSAGAIVNFGERIETDQIRSRLMYAVEESHNNQRDRLVFYETLDTMSDASDISLLARIHADALADMKYFRLYYQPIVETSSRTTVGAEALLRWIHPVYGEIKPNQFIAFLENDPCYYRLGLKILEQAVKDAKLIRQRIPNFRINVNITALQIQNDSFADNVSDILNKYDYAPEGLVLELTERCKEMDSSFLASRIEELRRRNILIAFDDLGTGYSTISLLMNIPVDEIKLDMDFVRQIKDRESYQLFVKALVLGSSSEGYKYSICFEGVENEEILDYISRYGDFLVQGYYFAKPMLIADLMEYIEGR